MHMNDTTVSEPYLQMLLSNDVALDGGDLRNILMNILKISSWSVVQLIHEVEIHGKILSKIQILNLLEIFWRKKM